MNSKYLSFFVIDVCLLLILGCGEDKVPKSNNRIKVDENVSIAKVKIVDAKRYLNIKKGMTKKQVFEIMKVRPMKNVGSGFRIDLYILKNGSAIKVAWQNGVVFYVRYREPKSKFFLLIE